MRAAAAAVAVAWPVVWVLPKQRHLQHGLAIALQARFVATQGAVRVQ
jgi:hypothetical protein